MNHAKRTRLQRAGALHGIIPRACVLDNPAWQIKTPAKVYDSTGLQQMAETLGYRVSENAGRNYGLSENQKSAMMRIPRHGPFLTAGLRERGYGYDLIQSLVDMELIKYGPHIVKWRGGSPQETIEMTMAGRVVRQLIEEARSSSQASNDQATT